MDLKQNGLRVALQDETMGYPRVDGRKLGGNIASHFMEFILVKLAYIIS
jgi:hypothetical protein